ncbi:MAG: RluA family pseudouridine synthase [Holosporales bacterium]|jgi:23S rRNA pseudouridine1911/1915/1917 synthase|nr:RluA family pseudouridine synthase [Holosporales bacterium]
MIIHITEKFIGRRLDAAISEILPNMSRTQIQKYIKNGVVLCDRNKIENLSKKISNPCEIEIKIEDFYNDNDYEITPENIDLKVIFEDEHIVIINKPPGTVCHPAPGHKTGTIANALAYKFKNLSDIGGKTRPGIVHRLDKDTSGIMLIAKTNAAHRAFSELFANYKGKLIKRKYICFVFGVPKEKTGRIETFLSRHPRFRQQYAPSDTAGKKAITLYSVVESVYFSSTKAISKINCELLTGRTHQIRVHMKYIGNHLIGDGVYGKTKIEETYPELIKNFPRQALHSSELSFIHPITAEFLQFKTNLPKDLETLEKFFIL